MQSLEPVCFLLLLIVLHFFLYIISYWWLHSEAYASLCAYLPQLQDTILQKDNLRVVVKCFQDGFAVLKFIISEQKSQTELQRDKLGTYSSLENMQCLLTESGVNHMPTWGEGRGGEGEEEVAMKHQLNSSHENWKCIKCQHVQVTEEGKHGSRTTNEIRSALHNTAGNFLRMYESFLFFSSTVGILRS